MTIHHLIGFALAGLQPGMLVSQKSLTLPPHAFPVTFSARPSALHSSLNFPSPLPIFPS
jgi:hypothetical protein